MGITRKITITSDRQGQKEWDRRDDVCGYSFGERRCCSVFLHPKESVDIAVLPMNAEFITDNNLRFPSFDIDEDAMSTEELRNNGVEEGSLVHRDCRKLSKQT